MTCFIGIPVSAAMAAQRSASGYGRQDSVVKLFLMTTLPKRIYLLKLAVKCLFHERVDLSPMVVDSLEQYVPDGPIMVFFANSRLWSLPAGHHRRNYTSPHRS
jgi:hypothetical protein